MDAAIKPQSEKQTQLSDLPNGVTSKQSDTTQATAGCPRFRCVKHRADGDSPGIDFHVDQFDRLGGSMEMLPFGARVRSCIRDSSEKASATQIGWLRVCLGRQRQRYQYGRASGDNAFVRDHVRPCAQRDHSDTYATLWLRSIPTYSRKATSRSRNGSRRPQAADTAPANSKQCPLATANMPDCCS